MTKVHHELRLLLTAVMFYTRIPVPRWVGHSDEALNQATRYFPMIGWIVGGGVGVVIWLASFVFPLSISVLLGMVAGILMTGAFHEDGFVDMCDGFGGGWTRERILTIMKDSRIGTFGTVGIALLLSLKFSALYVLGQANLSLLFITVIISHSTSRGIAATFIRTHPYVRDDPTSKAKPVAKRLSTKDLCIASGWAILPMIAFPHGLLLLSIVPCLLMRLYLGHYFTRWIGGYTGDCLGATQQLCEVTLLLTVLALWKFI